MGINNCVKLLEKLRSKLGVTRYGMAKRLAVSQTSYQTMEGEADTLRSDRLWRAWEIARDEAGIDSDTFFLKWFAEDARRILERKAKEKGKK